MRRSWYLPGVSEPFASATVDVQLVEALEEDDFLEFRYLEGDVLFDVRVEPPVVHRGIDPPTFRLPMPN